MEAMEGKATAVGMARIEMLAAMIIFGTIGVVVHYIDLPSSVIVLFRGVVGALFMLFIIFVTGNRLSWGDVRANAPVLVASGICLSMNWVFLFEAFKWTTVSTATLCDYLAPAFVILVSPVFLKERLTAYRVVCVLGAILGLALASGVFEQEAFGASDAKGILLGVTGAVFYTGLIILNKKLKGIGSYDRTFVQLAVGAVVVTAYASATVDFGSLSFDPLTLGLLVFLGVVPTAIAFTMYFGSMRSLKAQTVAAYGYLEPAVSLILSAIIIGENLGVIGWIGAALVLGSTLVSEMIDMRRTASG